MKKKKLLPKSCQPWGKWHNSFYKVALILIGLLMIPKYAFPESALDHIATVEQQTTRITGTIQDVNGETLIGVTVLEQGTTNGVMSDIDGKFTISVSSTATLSFSYIGYVSQNIKLKGENTLVVTLVEDSKTLDEVIVIGYGTVRKADLAGAVAVLDSKNFKDQPITRASDALQGRVSGVQVENSGIPGGGVKIRVRGSSSINKSNDPLYVVDGIVRESGLDGINPEDIQSMQVLKDASSTAIYGSRGSNGVVLVTSKKGKIGGREIMFDASFGVANVYKKYDLLNAYEYAQALTEIKGIDFTEQQMGSYKNGTAGIDWQDEIFRKGLTQNYKLAISSGSEKTQYYVSGNFMQHKGVVIESKDERYQVKANIASQFTDWLHITADVNASHGIRNGNLFESSKDNPIWLALNYSPTMEMMDANGNYISDPYNAIDNNPVGALKQNGSETVNDVFNGRIDLRFNIIKELTFTTTNGVDYSDAKGYSFTSKKVQPQSKMGNSNVNHLMLQSSNNLTYMKSWDNHNLTATGVYEVTSSETRSMDITGINLLTESVGWWDVNMASARNASNNYNKWALMSGVARVMYNYRDTYMLTGTLRADGSSRFSKDKWGYFPSIAAAWIVSNEKFMENVKVLQDFKLRASYGVIGSQAISSYSTLGLMSRTAYNFGTNNNFTGYWAKDIATPDLTWEKTRQFDIGVDFAMFNHRLNINLDYFDKRTTDALLMKSMPGYMGGGSYWVNDGEISNRGVDISLTAHIIQGSDFSWSSTINGTYLKNKVIKLSGGDNDFINGTTPAQGMVDYATIIKPGESIGTFWGYEWTGLDDNGNDTYADLDDSGTIDGSDRKVIGKSTPDFTLGWNNTFSYRNWDLNMFFNASFGAKRLNLARFSMASMVGSSRFITLKEAYYDGYDKVGQGSEYPSLTGTGNNYLPVSTKWLENANYLRLENISLSYNLSKKVTKFADIRFTASCQNLFTITGYKGMDPAGTTFSKTNIDVDAGIDMGAYPNPRTFTFGVRMNF